MTAPAGADPAVVGPYLATALDDPGWADPTVTLIAGGKSNLTYRVDSPAGSVVLRRPPLGHVLPTAHDMAREHRVMAALVDTAVPVPRMLHFCSDADVLGQPFYVMERVEGHIVTSTLPAGYAEEPSQRATLSGALVGVLADLHAVDPAAVGLGEFGRPEGYLARQVRRWGQQWEATRLDGLTDLDQLATDLTAAVPVSQRSGIVHGDPLADLGILLVYWAQGDDGATRKGGTVVPAATVLPGFWTRAQVAEDYARRTGADISELPWFVAFGFFKLAVVCAGIVARVRGGAMVGGGFEGFQERIAPLVELGQATLSDRRLHLAVFSAHQMRGSCSGSRA